MHLIAEKVSCDRMAGWHAVDLFPSFLQAVYVCGRHLLMSTLVHVG